MQSRRRGLTPGAKGRAAAAPPEDEKPVDSREILFPRTRTVPISTGARIVVRKWKIPELVEISRRLPERLQELFEGSRSDAAATSLIPGATEEVRWIVSISCDVPEAEIDAAWEAEDLLDVALAVVEVCIEPLGGKLASLGAKLLAMVPQAVQLAMPRARPPTTPGSSSPGPTSS